MAFSNVALECDSVGHNTSTTAIYFSLLSADFVDNWLKSYIASSKRVKVISTNFKLHGPSMFAIKAKIYEVLYKQSGSIAFDETSSYWSAPKNS